MTTSHRSTAPCDTFRQEILNTAITNVHRESRNLFLAQRFERHTFPLTTVAYTHPSDEEMYAKVRELPC